MSDAVTLNEVALNKRNIEHATYGRFVIRRPTNRVEADIDTVRTRQINRDLQAREVIEDPEHGGKKQVPAFLTREAKRDQLVFHGIWSEQDDQAIEDATIAYQTACFALDEAGYVGPVELIDGISALRGRLESLVPDPKDVAEALDKAVPRVDSPVPLDEYQVARATLQDASKSHEMDAVLEDADRLHKIAALYGDGLVAQTTLYGLRIREFSLFADTLEARADKSAQLAKVFYCTYEPSGEKRHYPSMDKLEEDDLSKIMWLLGEIEKLERMEPGETEQDAERKQRFDFLAPHQRAQLVLDGSREMEESSSDGVPAVTTPQPSTAPSVSTPKN